MLETAEYERPASDDTCNMLADKLVCETLELINPIQTEVAEGHGRLAVLSPFAHDKYFPDESLGELRTDEHYRTRVAGEFGDILWYAVALLAERNVTMRAVVERCFADMIQLNLVVVDPDSLESYSRTAAMLQPMSAPGAQDIDANPFVVYAGHYVSMFCRRVAPQHGAKESTTGEVIESGANLLWATAYLLENNCGTNLQTTLQDTYLKLKMREYTGVPQGQGVGQDHSVQ